MNVAFIVTSYWAYGELLISVQFAKRIRKYGFEPYFFIPPSHELILNQEGMKYATFYPKLGRINEVLLKDYENRCHPEFIILSDFLNYNFCEKHYGLTKESLKIFRGKLGTFDNFDWTIEKRSMDTYGFSASIASKVEIKDYGFQLIPCPIGNAQGSNTEDKFYYPLNDTYIEYNEETKARAREVLGLPKNKPMILTTSAMWQETYKLYPRVVSFTEQVKQCYDTIIKKMSSEAIIINIGKEDDKGVYEGNENIITIDHLPPKLFDEYAMACYLFLTRNITSTTLGKIASAGIPSLVLINSFDKDTIGESYQNREEKVSIDLYPYRMYPVGWYHFLDPLYHNNPYMEIVQEEEILLVDRVLETIHKMLYEETYRENIQSMAKNYRTCLEKLMKPEEILIRLNQ